MGLILKRIILEDYAKKTILYSKLVRGELDFIMETHHLEGGKHLQIFLYRNHPRIKEFIAIKDKKNHLTEQISQIKTDATQMRLTVNDNSFMIASSSEVEINITEYNFNQSLADFAKGKVAILIDVIFNKEIDNNKLMTELRNFNIMEDKNEETNN